jgi:predicted DNA-binding protein
MNPVRDSLISGIKKMASQISIRLPDEIIKRLNRAAKKSKKKRAEVLRAVIEVGLSTMEKPVSPNIVQRLNDLHQDLVNRMEVLPDLIRRMDRDVGDQSNINLATTATPAIDETLTPDENSAEAAPVFDLLPADSVADKEAIEVAVFEDTIVDFEAAPIETAQERAGLFQDGDGELQENQRTLADVIDVEFVNDQRISGRLRRARIHHGWSTDELGAALNMDVALVEDIESGRCEVPHSRGIRVEAKLQQWEAEMT